MVKFQRWCADVKVNVRLTYNHMSQTSDIPNYKLSDLRQEIHLAYFQKECDTFPVVIIIIIVIFFV